MGKEEGQGLPRARRTKGEEGLGRGGPKARKPRVRTKDKPSINLIISNLAKHDIHYSGTFFTDGNLVLVFKAKSAFEYAS